MAAISSSVATSSPRAAPITLRRSAQCPTRNPALTPRRPSSASRYSPKVDQVHGTPCLERGQGHALDLGHHAADVVGVLGVDRGQGEPAVAADHRRHAVHVGRGGGRVPEELGVVVGVRVDDAGGHHEPGGVELGAPPARRPRRRPRCGRPGSPTSAGPAGPPVPSMSVPDRMT